MKTSRRSFLAASAAFSAPFLFPSAFAGSVRRFAANEKVNVGVIGIGRISTTMDIPLAIKYTDLCRFTAVCDLDSKRLKHGVEYVKGRYRKLLKEENAAVKAFADYHDLLADPSIDAVEICLPDHWHALVACAALAAGKHVWLQKPFAQTIIEGRLIANIAKMKRRVVQVGSWQRSVEQFHRVCELVRNGRIGDIRRVEVGIGLDKAGGSSKAEPVPENLNYDMWLGPTPGADVTPYNWTRVHTQNLKRIGDRPGWIQMAPYGWGMITNWGAHHIDIAQWGLGKDASGPESVSGTCEWMDTSGGRLWNVHTTYDLHYSYNGGKTELHVCNKFPMGVKFIGEKGEWLYCMRGAVKVTPSDPDVPANGKMQPLMASKNRLLEKIANPKIPLATSGDHWKNWLEAIRKDDPSFTVTNAEAAQRSSTACCLGQMCMELGRGKKEGASVSWCAAEEKPGSEEAKKLMKPFARGKYNLPDELRRYGLNFESVLKG